MSLQPVDIPIVGGSNAVPQDDPQYTLNLYAEKVSDEVLTLKPTPGTTLQYQLAYNGGSRGLISVDGRLFGIRGAFFQEIVAGEAVLRGTLNSSTGKVAMIANAPPDGSAQILIVDDANGYVFSFSDSSFVTLTGIGGDNFLGGGSQAAYCAGRALVFKPGTQSFQMSDLYDFKTWTTTTRGTANTLTTPVIAVVSNGDLAYFFSSGGFEIWSDQGLPTLPISRILAGDKIGLLAPNSALFCERYVYWVGKSSTGQGIVYRHTGGGQPERISDHSTERNIAALIDTSDGNAFTYTSFGHVFYIVTFKAGNRTFAWDKATNLWHDRAQREPLSNAINALPFIATVVHNGMVLEADYRNGDIMEIDETSYTDNGNPIIRDRILPVTPKEGDFFTFYQSAELFGEIGNTPTAGLALPAPLSTSFLPIGNWGTRGGGLAFGASIDQFNSSIDDDGYAYAAIPDVGGLTIHGTYLVENFGGSSVSNYTTLGGIGIANKTLNLTQPPLGQSTSQSPVGAWMYKQFAGPAHIIARVNHLYWDSGESPNPVATPYNCKITIVVGPDKGAKNYDVTITTVVDALSINHTQVIIDGIDNAGTGKNGFLVISGNYHVTSVPNFSISKLTVTVPGNIPPVAIGQLGPNIMMRVSRDRGMTWEPEQWQQAGGNASYNGRTRWVGLGSAYGLSLWFRIVANQYISWRMVRMRLQ